MRMDSPLPDCTEGSSAAANFDKEVRFLLSVPHSMLAKRQKQYRAKVDSNPNRRGPKRKVKPSASPGPAV